MKLENVVIAAVVAVGLFTAGALSAPHIWPAEAPTAPVVTEDSPGWDCATMGNRECGESPQLDAYTRCLLAMDGAELPPGLCQPVYVADPSPSPSAS